MVTVAIISIISSALLSLITSSHREVKSLEEKLLTVELQRNLISTTLGFDLCAYAFTMSPKDFTFPDSNFSKPDFVVAIPALTLDAAGTEKLAVTGDFLPGSPSSLKVDAIVLSQFLARSSDHLATLSVQTSGVRSYKPVSIAVRVNSVFDEKTLERRLTGCIAEGPLGTKKPATRAECLEAGGAWVDPTGGRPSFCAFDNDVLEWF